jgi:hypothetical protein
MVLMSPPLISRKLDKIPLAATRMARRARRAQVYPETRTKTRHQQVASIKPTAATRYGRRKKSETIVRRALVQPRKPKTSMS